MNDLHDAATTFTAFTAFTDCAAQLKRWYAGGSQGARPPGRLQTMEDAPVTPFTMAWATVLNRLV